MTHSAAGAERHLLDPAVRADAAALEMLLHRDFQEVGRSGRVWSRSEIIEALVADPQVTGEPEDLEVDELAYGNALVTYTLAGIRRSSIWIRESGRWQIRFHQATPLHP
jgi:ribonuclease HI